MSQDIKNILDEIMSLNVNQCVLTTYDQSVAECVKIQIVKKLAEAHNIAYRPTPNEQRLFPVSNTKV
jgi:hypothetical protein